jgi:TRAP-type C4-dicarboxylate transport system permease small subunit
VAAALALAAVVLAVVLDLSWWERVIVIGLPLLFLSLARETWRAFGQLEGWRFGAVLVGFGLLCSIILIAGLHRERSTLYAPTSWPSPSATSATASSSWTTSWTVSGG